MYLCQNLNGYIQKIQTHDLGSSFEQNVIPLKDVSFDPDKDRIAVGGFKLADFGVCRGKESTVTKPLEHLHGCLQKYDKIIYL